MYTKKLIPIVVLLVMLVIPVSSVFASTTTFKDVTINTDRTGLELNYTTDTTHTLILWHISEVQNNELKLTHTISQRDLEKTIETTDSYVIQYLLSDNRFYIKIESDASAITITIYTTNYSMKYADSTLQLFYAIDGVGTTLDLDKVAIKDYQGSITLSKTQTPVGGFSMQASLLVIYSLFWWIFVAVWFVIGLVLAIWVYKDAQKRTCGREGLLWLIVVLVAGIIGLIIYLVLRKGLRCRGRR